MRRGFHGDARRQRPGVRAPGRRAVLFGTAPAGQPASQQTPGVLRGSPEPCGRLGECAGTPRCKRCSRRSTLAPRPLPPHILRGLGDRAGPAGRPAQVAGSRTDFLPQNDLNGLALPTCLGQVGMAVTQENTGDEIAAHAPARKEAGAGPPAGGRRALSPDPHARAHTHSHAHTLTRSHTHACTLTRPRMLTLTGTHVHTHARTDSRTRTHARSPPPPRSVCRPTATLWSPDPSRLPGPQGKQHPLVRGERLPGSARLREQAPSP